MAKVSLLAPLLAVLAYVLIDARGQIEVFPSSADIIYILGSRDFFVRECRFRNGFVHAWRWLRNTETITRGVTSTSESSRFRLLPTADSGGLYICEAYDDQWRLLGSTSVGNLMIRTTEQVVLVKPVQYVVKGGNIVLKCTSPLENVDIHWVIGLTGMTFDNLYSITNASEEDSGSYTCILFEGDAGRNIAQRSVQLFVYLPFQVFNVQVFQYSPLATNSVLRNALVTWSNVSSVVIRYNITVIDYTTGNNLNLSQTVLDDKTSYSVLQMEDPNQNNSGPILPLVNERIYGVEVTAEYDNGPGPTSTRVNFTLSTTARYPMQLLALEPTGMTYYGENTHLNQELRVQPNAGPIVVDAIDRRAYWYERTLKQVVLQNLAPGGTYKPLFRISAGKEVVSLTYDWIAKMLYITYINNSTRKLELFRRQIYNLDREENVLPRLQFTVGPNAIIHSEINPVAGFFYYSITEDETTRMYLLNLRARTRYTEILPVSSTITSGPDFAINPRGNSILFGDKLSGHIYQCSQSFNNCNIYVNRAILMAKSGRSHVGLPPRNIKYGGDFIYWTSDSPGLYAVKVSNPTILIVVDSNSRPNFIVPLSPDQQPLPAIECLAPNAFRISNRQLVRLEFATNTSLQISWQDNPDLKSYCESAQFSIAPFVFTFTIEDNSGFSVEKVTRKRQTLITDLRPSTDYTVNVSALNEYSITRGETNLAASEDFHTADNGGCKFYSNGNVSCIIGNQTIPLVLKEGIRSIAMKCGVFHVGPSLPFPSYKWTKDGMTVISNGRFTREFYTAYPLMQGISSTPIIISGNDTITLNLKPEADSNSEMHTFSCYHHMFQANLEDTLYYLAEGLWTCDVESIYQRGSGGIAISEPDLCSDEDQCGGFSCDTVAKTTCCNCPMGADDYFSKDLGKQCTRNVCPSLIPVQHGRVHISFHDSGSIIGTYSCNKGFKLVGNPNRTCQQSSRQWTGIMPMCKGSGAMSIYKELHFLKIVLLISSGHIFF